MAEDQHRRGGLQVEYAVSSRAACKSCGGAIKQGSMRVGKETKSDYHDGWDLSWFHYSCCNKKYGAPSFSAIKELKEWEHLRWDDQIKIKKDIGEKIETTDAEKQREKDNRALWELKDEVEDNLKKPVLQAILEANGMSVGKKDTPARLVHKVADGMHFGFVGPCPECSNLGSLRWNGFDYACKGWISSFTRCEFRGVDKVERFKWKIPAELKKAHEFLKEWTYPDTHPKKYYVKEGEEGASKDEEGKEEVEEEEEDEDEDDSVPEDEVPVGQELYGVHVLIAGTKKELGMTQDELTELIEEHGGRVDDQVYSDTTVMIAPESEVKKKKKVKKVADAIKFKVPILSVEFIQKLAAREDDGIKLRNNDVAEKFLLGPSMGEGRVAKKYLKAKIEKEKLKEEKEKEKEEKARLAEEAKKANKRKRPEPKAGSDILKVDPDSGHSGSGEILVTYDDESGYNTYNVMLNSTDIKTGVNKYYRMQIIKTKGKKSWYFWISWGRVGTTTGDSKLYPKGSERTAIEAFVEKFKQHTGNEWSDRDSFEKKPGLYYLVALDDGNEDEEEGEQLKQLIKKQRTKKDEKSESKEEEEDDDDSMEVDKKSEKESDRLPLRVQELVKLIFDKEMMKKALQALDVDIKKMPLGKISKSQIKKGYQVLTQIQDVLESTNPSKSKLADFSNQFYTLIPHDFGHAAPPVINDIESVKRKLQLMDTLGDIEIAASLVKDSPRTSEEEAIENNYKALKARISPLDKSAELYSMLETYAYNTHDQKYFSGFKFTVEDIYEIDRQGEGERFAPWKDNENRMLLWHGSRLTNWVGIISSGLRIAPPEAPKTGYRFGKGVYFADIISKSGSYCFTSNDNPHAVMLLAEVSLGKTNDLLRDEYMEKAPDGFHSTKALGGCAPDPKSDKFIDGGKVRVPIGKPTTTGIKSLCSHNEYIIYDVAQVKIRYLLRLKFNHTRGY